MKFSGTQLSKIREKKGLSVNDLVFALDKVGRRVSWPTVNNWELGKSTPDADAVAALAEALECRLDDFYSK